MPVTGFTIYTSGAFTPLHSDLSECYYLDDQNNTPQPCMIVDGWYDMLQESSLRTSSTCDEQCADVEKLSPVLYDLEMMFHEEEYAVEYFVINGNAEYVEIDIPTDLIDGVFMIHVNDENVDDERVSIDGNKVIVNYGQNIVSVKLFGYYELGGLENENKAYGVLY